MIKFFNKKIKVTALFCLLIFLTLLSVTTEALNFRVKIAEDKAIYLLVVNDPARILKVNVEGDKIEFQEMLTFQKIFDNEDLKVYYDFDLLTWRTSDQFVPGEYWDLNIISLKKPWLNKKCEVDGIEDLFPVNFDNHICLVSHLPYSKNLEPYYKYTEKKSIIKLIDTDTLATKPLTEDFLKQQVKEAGVFKVYPNKLTYIRIGMGEIDYPYFPAVPLFDKVDKLLLIYDIERYAFFRSHNYPKERKGKPLYIYVVDKDQNQWRKYSVKGDQSDITVINDYLVVKVDYIPDKGSDNYTGEYDLINFKSGKQQSIKLDEEEKVLFINNDFLLATQGHKLLYIPVENEEVEMGKASILYEDPKAFTNTWREIVRYTEAVFLGPREIPREALIGQAKRLNEVGEDFFKNKWEISKAIDYFKKAIALNPNCDQYYINLGLSYCDIHNSDEAIKVFSEAMKVSKNNTNKAKICYYLGIIYEEKQEWEEALKWYQNASNMKENPEYKKGVERVRQKLNENKNGK